MSVTALAVFAGVISVAMSQCSVDTLFARYAGTSPGASIAVVKDGAIVFEHSYGLAKVDTNEPTTADTNYRLASVTKQFTAMAIAILAERGALSIDAPVTKYLPELVHAPKVTLRHLLTHMSGLPHYEDLLGDDPKQVSDRDVLALVAPQTPAVAPGTKYAYSNTGYALLALVIERVSKLTYAEFVRRNIFTPLGMTASVVYDPYAPIAHRAYGYRHGEPADQSRTSAVKGDGGIYSSVRDLARWIDALDRSTLIAPARLAEATSALVATDAPGISYGFGWRIEDHDGDKLVLHTGSTSGFKNALVWLPAKKLAVIVLTNRAEGEPVQLAKLVLDRYR